MHTSPPERTALQPSFECHNKSFYPQLLRATSQPAHAHKETRKWLRICRRISYSPDYESISKKLQNIGQPSPRSAKIIFKCPTQFLFKRKSGISHRDFLHIDQALKPRPCGPCWTFPSEPFARKREAFVLNASIFKDVIVAFRWKDFTLPVQIPHPSQAKFKYPHPTGTDDDQVSVGCRGGGVGEVEALNWYAHDARGFHQQI